MSRDSSGASVHTRGRRLLGSDPSLTKLHDKQFSQVENIRRMEISRSKSSLQDHNPITRRSHSHHTTKAKDKHNKSNSKLSENSRSQKVSFENTGDNQEEFNNESYTFLDELKFYVDQTGPTLASTDSESIESIPSEKPSRSKNLSAKKSVHHKILEGPSSSDRNAKEKFSGHYHYHARAQTATTKKNVDHRDDLPSTSTKTKKYRLLSTSISALPMLDDETIPRHSDGSSAEQVQSDDEASFEDNEPSKVQFLSEMFDGARGAQINSPSSHAANQRPSRRVSERKGKIHIPTLDGYGARRSRHKEKILDKTAIKISYLRPDELPSAMLKTMVDGVVAVTEPEFETNSTIRLPTKSLFVLFKSAADAEKALTLFQDSSISCEYRSIDRVDK